MRLLNASTKKLEEFFERDVPKYAILSHTWGKDEITFKDLDAELGLKRPSIKIEGCCTQASTDGLDYVWIDTICIDKSSSAELSEAINSMFAWYEKAEVCYIYLSDVQSVFVDSEEFPNSRWFTRGWTLQELLAPLSVMFYNASWMPLKYSEGHDSNQLGNLLAEITGIRADIIEGHQPLTSASVAERMSWASFRQTTRVEDIAYCLLGLFEIAMPLIYGEGTKAFFRLQEEIGRSMRDHSIFAFGYDLVSLDHGYNLAKSPGDFMACGNVTSLPQDYKIISPNRSHYTSTNNGLHIPLQLVPLATGGWIGMLECRDNSFKGDLVIAIPLFQDHKFEEVFYRHAAGLPELVTAETFRNVEPRHIYIHRSGPKLTSTRISGIKLSCTFLKHIKIKATYPPHWDVARGEHQERWLPRDTLQEQVLILDCLNNEDGNFLVKIKYSYKRGRLNGGNHPMAAQVSARPVWNALALNYVIHEDSLPKTPWKRDPWVDLEDLTSPVGGDDNARLYVDKTNSEVWELDIVDVAIPESMGGTTTDLPIQAREHRLSLPSSPSGSSSSAASYNFPDEYGGRNGTRLARFHELQLKKA